MHVGVLTGGGDCPGLNAVIRAVTLSLIHEAGARVTGIEQGFLGLVERRARPLDVPAVMDIVNLGGTILGTHNRANPFAYFDAGGADVSAAVMDYVRELGLDALVVIGGDGTMTIAHKLGALGLPIVGVPKTIDNDLMASDRSFGFDSAVAVVAEAIMRLETTAQSHRRVMLVETMGRYAGWIALEAGLAGGADVILIPEVPYDVATVVARCRAHQRSAGSTLICVAEGAAPVGGQMTVERRIAGSPDPLRLGGVVQTLRAELEQHLDSEVRATVLGHVQRGGPPTAFDRVLATRLGCHAAELVRARQFGVMVALQGDAMASVPLAAVAGACRTVPPDHELIRAARALGVVLGDQ
ncbi:MAG: ATP-dependent 6-phosphofructokinase [Proteobacteria bacterium]|nr:ATP-dependent 6-phosphofructokinase [Pseudomonadota bacterium]